MGWDRVTLTIYGHTSAHNSDQDIKDQADWDEFVWRVRMIAAEHRYEHLELDVG